MYILTGSIQSTRWCSSRILWICAWNIFRLKCWMNMRKPTWRVCSRYMGMMKSERQFAWGILRPSHCLWRVFILAFISTAMKYVVDAKCSFTSPLICWRRMDKHIYIPHTNGTTVERNRNFSKPIGMLIIRLRCGLRLIRIQSDSFLYRLAGLAIAIVDYKVGKETRQEVEWATVITSLETVFKHEILCVKHHWIEHELTDICSYILVCSIPARLQAVLLDIEVYFWKNLSIKTYKWYIHETVNSYKEQKLMFSEHSANIE